MPALPVDAARTGVVRAASDPALRYELADGSKIAVRAIVPEDEALEHAFISGLSAETAYSRLFSARKLTPEEIRRLTHFDRRHEAALAALPAAGAACGFVGVARYVKDAQGRNAEFALVVSDAWQHRGVGRALLHALERHARSDALAVLGGHVLASNRPMLGLARKLGYAIAPVPGDATLRLVQKRLMFPNPPRACAYGDRAGCPANDACHGTCAAA